MSIVVALALLLVVLQGNEIDRMDTAEQLLFPDFKSVANRIDNFSIQRLGDDEALAIHKIDDRWTVPVRDNYTADVGKLRELIIALADARIVEEKTSNPAYYSKLGVDDPAQGGNGTKLTASGVGFSYTLILGNRALGDFRYSRIDGEDMSFLIDQNPAIPVSASDWLLPNIIDIAVKRIQKVSIVHMDGETIVIAKDEEEQSDFDVLNIPKGRELRYATVGNGIAGALGNLTLRDVRRRTESSPIVTTRYETWDGQTIIAEVVSEDEQYWVSFSVSATVGDSTSGEESETINERLADWQYQLPEHKAKLLTQQWDSILKPQD